MNNAASPSLRYGATVSLTLGVWAAAIALAPGLAARAVLAAPAVLAPLAWWTIQDRTRWVGLFLAAVILLPPLPVAWGDSGPHPALLPAALGLLAGVLWLGEWRVRLSGLSAALAAMLFVLAASVPAAAFYSGAGVAAGSAARVALFAVTPFLFGYVLHGPAGSIDAFHQVRRLYWFAIVAAVFACVDFYFQLPAPAGFGAQFVWLDSGVYRRAQGMFYEASTLGNFCVFFLVMIAAALARPPRRAPAGRMALAGGAAVLLAALVLSFSRGSVACLAVALATLAWLNRRRWGWLRLAAAATLAAPAGAWLIWKIFPSFAETYWVRLSASARFFFSSADGVLSGRVASWSTLLDWAATHPAQLLFGIGYKTLPYTTHLGSPMVADNMYLSLLVEAGVAGLGALLWLNAAVLREAYRASRSPEPDRAFLGSWVFCFWAGEAVQMLSGDLLTYWRVLPIYFFVIALAVRP